MSESPISATLRLRRSWAVRLPLSRAMLYAKIRGFAAAAAAALRRRLLGWCTAEQACGLRPGRILHCCRTVLRVKSQSRPHAAGGGFAEAASERSTEHRRRFGGVRNTVTHCDARARPPRLAGDAAQRAAAARLYCAPPPTPAALPIALTRPKRSTLAATNAAIQDSVQRDATTTQLGGKKKTN